MLASIKKCVFYIAKYLGAFRVSRHFYKNRIRVLCYHGFEIEDESKFLPKLFMRPQVFRSRMLYLKKQGYHVISLQSACDALTSDADTVDSVVLTIDDGFYSFFRHAAPVLQEMQFPATLYLTSYYFDKNSPIFPLAVKYMLWRSKSECIDTRSLGIPGMQDAVNVSKDDLIDAVIEHGQKLSNSEDRVAVLRKLGDVVGVSYDQVNGARIMGLINKGELIELVKSGIDIQMHTHRHDFPLDPEISDYEIRRNRELVDPLLEAPMRHFCYPSGLWSALHWDVLRSNGIASATTCLPGLVDGETALYAIPRFLDGANISRIEFEAEVSGFAEFCRTFKSFKVHLLG